MLKFSNKLYLVLIERVYRASLSSCTREIVPFAISATKFHLTALWIIHIPRRNRTDNDVRRVEYDRSRNIAREISDKRGEMQTIATISFAYTSENKSVDIEEKSMIRREICARGSVKYNERGKAGIKEDSTWEK